MASVNYWHSASMVGSHHIANALLRSGWNVAFITSPISPFHVLQGITPELKDRVRIYRQKHDISVQHLWPYVPGALVTPLNKPVLRSRWVHRHWQNLTCPNVVEEAKRHGYGEVDLLYIDNPIQSFWLDSVKYKTSVYRVTDNSMGFSRSASALGELEKDLIRRVDVVAYTASNLAESLQSIGPRKMFHLPNGVDYSHFSKAAGKPADFSNIPGPRAIYIGAMDEWFDYELLNQAVRELPKISFVLIGPDNLAKARLKSASNLFILGRKSFSELPAYLQHSDVGIIPFDVKNYGPLVHSVNPLKLYEYMACGLPVVSARWKELENIESPAVLSHTAEEFIAGIASVVQEPGDAGVRRRYAATQDWRERTHEILSSVGITSEALV